MSYQNILRAGRAVLKPRMDNQKASMPVRIGSCAVLLFVLFTMINAVQSSTLLTTSPSSDIEKAKLADLNDNIPFITVNPTTDATKIERYALSPDCTVTLNDEPAKLGCLAPGDDINMRSDGKGHALSINAYRSTVGIVTVSPDNRLALTTDYLDKYYFGLANNAKVLLNDSPSSLSQLKPGDQASVYSNQQGEALKVQVIRKNVFFDFWENFRKNLFKPLLLFFYLGFSVPLLKIAFEFPYAVYQGLTIYLMLAIGWHGGEELAVLSGKTLQQAIGFMAVGFVTNTCIGFLAYGILRWFIPKMRKIDAAAVSAYYGSDSAGTFLTCVGALQVAHIAYAAYMPVMLAVMEIPGCLVGIYLASKLRKSGMDQDGNMPDEPGYNPLFAENLHSDGEDPQVADDRKMSKALRELFLNPGIFLLFGGIVIGFVGRLQGHTVVQADDTFFISLFQGMLSLFLLEMGVTAAKRLKDLQVASWRFIVFGLAAPNLFACMGIASALLFSHAIHQPLQLGTYVLFAVLCSAASYIAVPAIQRLAIPEASPTLPLAASLGLTFSYNVTIGIPLYIVIAQHVITTFPV